MRTQQVILIRRDLKMRRGKEISQSAHASMAVITNTLIGYPFKWYKLPFNILKFIYLFLTHTALRTWLTGSFTKICLQVHSEEELKFYYQQAKDAGILCSLIQDKGLTEFGGVPTYTAVAIGPDEKEKIDLITGKLTLY